MKKALSVILILVLALSFAACGNPAQKAIVGAWELVDTETEATYGFGLEFKKDGTMSYGLTEELVASLGELSEEEAEEALEGMGYLMEITYKVKSDTVMEITVSALMGLAKEKTDVEYSLNGDTLVFDGATYQRVK
ncbi:MAG: hypothetical protein GX683_06020 [Ruminococcaceae bacterium]|nr:hypothetical protein [Oscillospiraceae bacterium]